MVALLSLQFALIVSFVTVMEKEEFNGEKVGAMSGRCKIFVG